MPERRDIVEAIVIYGFVILAALALLVLILNDW